MKKCVVIFLIIVSVLMWSGCQAEERINPNYEVLVYGFSDSIDNSGLEVEYRFNPTNETNTTVPPENIELDFHGIHLNGRYDGPIHKGSCHTYSSYLYWMDQGGFCIDEDGNVTVFHFGYDTPSSEPISPQQAQRIAEEFASKIFDISLYSISVDDNEKCYWIEFRKHVGSFETTDHARIAVDYTGKLCSYTSSMLNRVPINTKVDDIDMEAVENAVINKLNEVFADEREYCKSIEYSEFEYKLTTLADGKRAIVCTVDAYVYLEIANGVDGRVGEQINLMIKLPE